MTSTPPYKMLVNSGSTGSHKKVVPASNTWCLWTSSQSTQQTNADSTSIHPPKEAHNFLLVRKLIMESQPITLNNLETSLLHITDTQKIPKTIKVYICSIAILLTDLSRRLLVSNISTTVNEHLLNVNGTLCPIIDKLKELTSNIKHSSMDISTTAGKLNTKSSNNEVEKIIVAITPHPSMNSPTAPQLTSNNGTTFPSYPAALGACVTKPISLQSCLLAKCTCNPNKSLLTRCQMHRTMLWFQKLTYYPKQIMQSKICCCSNPSTCRVHICSEPSYQAKYITRSIHIFYFMTKHFKIIKKYLQ